MRLDTLAISNYRSITNAHKIVLSNMTVLVGKNNEGKSNILKALATAMRIMEYYSQDPRILRNSRFIHQIYNWEEDYPIQLQEKNEGKSSNFDLNFNLTETEIKELKDLTGIRLSTPNIPIEIMVGNGVASVNVRKRGSSSFKTKGTEITRLVGFADIGKLYDDTACCELLRYPKGVSVAIAIPRDVILSIKEKPTRAYFDAYHSINDKLNQPAMKCEMLLQKEGFAAYAQTTGRVHETESYHTPMPHKTVAVSAGIGWIGKCALLITEQYGSAIRLTSVLTDAPLPADNPVVQSKCGACNACSKACPAHAVTGILWEPGMKRERMFHASECRAKARAIAMDELHEEITLQSVIKK